MEDKDRFKETYEHFLAYVKERSQLFRLELTDRISREVGALGSKLILAVLLLLGILFLSTTLALFLGELFGRLSLGFATVGGFYVLLFLILALLRGPLIQKPITNGIIKRIFKGDEDDE